MGLLTRQVLAVSLWALLCARGLAEIAESQPDSDMAEYRQGGVGQQYLSSYPGIGMYGNGYQYLGNSAGSGNYGNMLRQLYRPSSFGLTDKVRNWVKSFLNRRQYVKPYYTPALTGLGYSADDLSGKPVYVGATSYKPVSVPLRQIQKYYKPFYSTSDGAQNQYVATAQRGIPDAAVSGNGVGSYGSYSPTSYSANSGSAASGLYGAGGAGSTGGSSNSYVPNSSVESAASYNLESAASYPLESAGSYPLESAGSYPVESAYSMSYQRPQSSNYNAAFEKAGFQPVAFGGSSSGSSYKNNPSLYSVEKSA